MKHCKSCKLEKGLEEFGKDSKQKDGKNPECKPCARERSRAYRAANIEKVREQDRARHKRNPEPRRERSARWYEENRDRALAYSKEYNLRNAKKVRARAAAWYAANPDRAYDRRLQYQFGITAEMYYALLEHQGFGCAVCGTQECPSGRRLSIDHDHNCCPPNMSNGMVVRACGKCVRGIVCSPCNTTNRTETLAPVNWNKIMEAKNEAAKV